MSGVIMAESIDTADATQAVDSEVYAIFTQGYRDELSLTLNIYSAD